MGVLKEAKSGSATPYLPLYPYPIRQKDGTEMETIMTDTELWRNKAVEIEARLMLTEQKLANAEKRAETAERALKRADHLFTTTNNKLADVERQLAQMREAIKPFTHKDLCKPTSGCKTDSSPVFGRDKALLLLGDFRRAADALNG